MMDADMREDIQVVLLSEVGSPETSIPLRNGPCSIRKQAFGRPKDMKLPFKQGGYDP